MNLPVWSRRSRAAPGQDQKSEENRRTGALRLVICPLEGSKKLQLEAAVFLILRIGKIAI